MRPFLLELADRARTLAIWLMAAGLALDVAVVVFERGYDEGLRDSPAPGEEDPE
jgi:hypothetical protein